MALVALPVRRSLFRGLLQLLPRGRALPPDVWWRRHRGILVLLWLHVPAVMALSIVQSVGIAHGAVEAGAVAAFAALATTGGRTHRRLSTVIASVGLLTASAVLVHLSDGLIEMHFHYFVMVAVVTLYQDWRPFLVAIGYVVLQHGVAGAVAPESVYNHAEAVADPWTWAGVHGFFVLGMSVAGIISWRLNESLLDAAGERELKLAEAQEIGRLGSWQFDIASGALEWSAEMYRLYDVDESVVPNRAKVSKLIHPDDIEAFDTDIARCIAGDAPLALDYRVVLSDGSIRWLHRRGEVTASIDGVPSTMAGTVQDVTDRRHAEDELHTALSLLNATLDATPDGILVVDLEGRITSYNLGFVEMWQIPEEVMSSRDDDAALGHVLGALADPDAFVVKVKELYARPEAESDDTLEFTDGRVVERHSKPQRVRGEIVGRVWSFRDVTERSRLETQLAHQAFHDPLTDLANQALFRDRVEHALARSTGSGTDVAVIFLDLDNFKTVNDSLGHVAGDEVLVTTTTRIRSCLRPADTAARLGGDEFAVLIEDTEGSAEAMMMAERLLAALRQPFAVADREVFVGASAGIAVGTPELSSNQLLRNADLAMYRAKSRGRGRYEVFAQEMHHAALERLDLEGDLRRAIARHELRLHYQPIVDIESGEIAGVEALVRWQHPVRGLVGPDVFIPLAEESGLIDDIGRWVLDTACRQARLWQQAHPRPKQLRLSLNVSPRQLRDDRLVDLVRAALANSGLPAPCLIVEITEGAMMHDADVALRRLTALKRLGVQLSVDDFGTGYSSLSYLQRFPIDELKVDRSFVQRIDQGPEESSLARAIVKLAQTLRLRAVAEGVETPAQLAVLRRLGCEHAQGFLLHRPQPPEAIEALLAQPVVATDFAQA